MCTVSMIYDHYKPQFQELPKIDWNYTTTVHTIDGLDKFEKLIKEFREALALAEKLDKLTKQPDCVDPEKAKLELRVKELEVEIAAFKKAQRKKPLIKKYASKSKK